MILFLLRNVCLLLALAYAVSVQAARFFHQRQTAATGYQSPSLHNRNLKTP